MEVKTLAKHEMKMMSEKKQDRVSRYKKGLLPEF